jgi:hypothetical protein
VLHHERRRVLHFAVIHCALQAALIGGYRSAASGVAARKTEGIRAGFPPLPGDLDYLSLGGGCTSGTGPKSPAIALLPFDFITITAIIDSVHFGDLAIDWEVKRTI